MLIKRLFSFVAAMAIAASSAAVMVSADDESDTPAIVFTADAEYLSPDKQPALSFDNDSFTSYLHLTRNGDEAGLKFSQDKDTYYQGNSLKVTAKSSGIDGYVACSGMVRDSDNALVYPDAPDVEETDSYKVVGFELQAEDFGLSCFDGCLINFTYRLTEEDQNTLLGDTVWVYSATEDEVRTLDNPTKLKVDTKLNDNVSQYQTNGLLSVPDGSSSTKIVFDISPLAAIDGAVLYLDNIIIELPDTVGNNKYVKSVDGYNSKAEPRKTSDTIKISKTTDTGDATKKVESADTKISPAIIAVIVVAGLAVIVGVFFLIKKLRNRFY